jgi:hypothetical protein
LRIAAPEIKRKFLTPTKSRADRGPNLSGSAEARAAHWRRARSFSIPCGLMARRQEGRQIQRKRAEILPMPLNPAIAFNGLFTPHR